MKRRGTGLARLLSIVISLALLLGMLPGALAANTALNYYVDSDRTVEIQDDDLYNYCKSETGYGMNSIWFTDLPASRQGVLTYADGRDRQYSIQENSTVNYSDLYYLVFQPNRDFAGTVFIPFEGRADNGSYYSGQLKITVNGVNSSSSNGTLSYSVAVNGTVALSGKDFDQYVYDETPKGHKVNYIRFTELPSSSKGVLYSGYSGWYQSEVKRNTSYSSSELDQMTFVPARNYEGTVTLPFTGTADSGESFSGSVVITVGRGGSSSGGTLTYSVAANGTVALSGKDFDQYVYDRTPAGVKVSYIRFTELPSSSRGVLYASYGGWYQSEVKRNTSYNSSELDQMTFVPARNYEGTVTLPFTGQADSGESFSGSVVITVGRGSSSVTGDVTYDVAMNSTVALDRDHFDQYVYDKTPAGIKVDYIRFTSLPSASRGVLYYSYGSRYQSEVRENASYNADELDQMTFVPARNYDGAVTIPFTGKADSSENFSGDLVIRVGSAAAANVTVSLQAGTGGSLTFQSSSFNDACQKETGANLDYVTFDYTSGRNGSLYYKYNQSGQSAVGTQRYYRSSSPSLDDVTFVPGTGTGTTATIPFSGKATNGRTFQGKVEIQFVTLQEPNMILYASEGRAVNFSAVDFVTACAARGGQMLVSVRFLTPDTTSGQLYYDFESPAKFQGTVNSGVEYALTGIYQLGKVSFLPTAGYTGVVSLPYVGTDAAGLTFNGTVSVVVAPDTTSSFTDMASYSWAIPSVEFLAGYGITTGSGNGTTYSPLSKMTRGDYILMLCRSFGITSTQTASFSDVPANSYYASALAAAKTLGIATADSSGKFHPTDPVTREDSMVFLYRALKAVNRPMIEAGDVVLSRFPDSASVSSSARSAVAAMVQAGVIVGDGQGRLNPRGTLTRAEMAVILHRGLTL